MPKTVLITGANGFVGQHLAKELADNGYAVVAVGGSQGNSEPIPHVSSYKVVDLTKPEETDTIDFSNVDGVVHLAGLAAVGPSFDDPMLYISTNVGIEANLFESARKQQATPRFIIVSSGTLYDPKADLPLTESSAVEPSSPYAVSKIGQEQLGHYYGSRGFECIVARPFNHIGPGQGPGFIVPDITQQVVAVENGQASSVKVGNLDAQRDYTDVRDIARAYRLLLEKGRPNEVYNICSGTPISGHDMLQKILHAAQVDARVEQDSSKMRPSDNPVVYGSHDRLSEHTGWQPEIPLDTTIADVVADWRSRQS